MSCENVLYRTKCVRTAVLFCENVLDGTKKRLSIPFSPTVSLDIPRILHLLQNICGFQANSLVGNRFASETVRKVKHSSERIRNSISAFTWTKPANFIQFVRKYPPFSGQNVLGVCYRSDIRVTMAQRKIGVNIALFLHRFGKYDETV